MSDNENSEFEQIKEIGIQKTGNIMRFLPQESTGIQYMIRQQATEAYTFQECNKRLETMYKKMGEKLDGNLVKPFKNLANTYNKFFSTYAHNLGVLSAITEDNIFVLPNCLLDSVQFNELCKINGEILNTKYTRLRPLMEVVETATAELCGAICDYQAAENRRYLLQHTDRLAESQQKMDAKTEEIKQLKKLKHQANVDKLFYENNKNNSERVRQYELKRLESLHNNSIKLENSITDAKVRNKTTTETSYSRSGWWIFSSSRRTTHTKTVYQDTSSMESQKSRFSEEIRKCEERLQAQNQNFKTANASLVIDVRGYDQEIDQAVATLKKMREEHDKAATDLLHLSLNLAMNREDTKEFSKLIHTLKFLLVSISYEIGKMDTTVDRLSAVLDNAVLTPASKIQSIYNIFTFPIKYSIITTDSLGVACDPQYAISYNKFRMNNENTFQAALKHAPAEIILEKEEEMAEDGFARGAASLYGY